MRKYFKQKDGFTLIEVILSIAILSIVSVVVLRLFVVSHNLNETTKTSDIANTTAVNIMENLKTYEALEDFLVDYPWLTTSQDLTSGSLRYDATFSEPVEDGAYELGLVLNKDITYDGLYNINLTIMEPASKKILTEFSTSHYFKDKGGLDD